MALFRRRRPTRRKVTIRKKIVKKKTKRKVRRKVSRKVKRRPVRRVKKKVKRRVRRKPRAKPRKVRKKVRRIKRIKRPKPKKRKVKPKVKKKVIKKVIKVKLPKVKVPEKISDEKAFDMIRRYVPTAKYIFCKKEDDLTKVIKRIGFPMVMKVSGDVVHKTDIGGVIININSLEQAKESFEKLMKIKGAEKILIQEQLDGTEMIIGSKYDPQFGSVVTIGFGGIYTEVLKDVSFRVCPISMRDAQEMVRELKGFEILKGVRGKKAANFLELYNILIKICRLSVSRKIKEMDINPLFVDDKGAKAADVRIII